MLKYNIVKSYSLILDNGFHPNFVSIDLPSAGQEVYLFMKP
jgi:hypothetical protein